MVCFYSVLRYTTIGNITLHHQLVGADVSEGVVIIGYGRQVKTGLPEVSDLSEVVDLVL